MKTLDKLFTETPLLLVLFIFLVIISCNANSQLLTSIKVNNKHIELYSLQGKCAIRDVDTSSSRVLSINHPCGFVRASARMEAQTYSYSSIGKVFIIAGPPEASSVYTGDDSVKFENQCSNQGQVLIVKASTMTLGKIQIIPLGFCHQLGFDEKDFYGYAYPVDLK